MTKREPIVIATICGCALLWAFAVKCFPTPLGDSRMYVPPALSVAQGRGLTNQFDRFEIPNLDKTGAGRFFNYPPLFPLLTGHLTKFLSGSGTPEGIFLVMGFYGVLTLVLTQMIFLVLVRRSLCSVPLAVFAILTRTLQLSYMTGFRAEALGSIWSHTSMLLALLYPGLVIPQGILLGLMAVTHPAGALVMGSMLGMWYAYTLKTWDALVNIFWVSILALHIFFGTFVILNPYPLLDYVNGFLVHVAANLAEVSRSMREAYAWRLFFISTDAPLIGVQVIAAINLMFLRRSSWLFYLLMFFMWAIMLKTIFLYPWHYYYWLMFSPLILAILARGRWFSKSLIAIPGFALLRVALVFVFFLLHGVTLEDARQKFRRLDAKMPAGTVYSSTTALWVLTDNYQKVQFARRDKSENTVYLGQQTYMAASVGVKRGVLADYFCRYVPRILGIPLGRWPQGYGFYAYKEMKGSVA
jgi:hypothetical protein